MDRRKMNKKKIISRGGVYCPAYHQWLPDNIRFDISDINPYPRTFFMIINSFLGDFGFIMMFWDWRS